MAQKKLKKPAKTQKRILRGGEGVKSQNGKAEMANPSIAIRGPLPVTEGLKSHVAARPGPSSKPRRKSASPPASTAQASEDKVTAMPPLPILKRIEPKSTKDARETNVVGQKTKLQMPKSPKVQTDDLQSEIETLKDQLAAMRMAVEKPATRVETPPPSATAPPPPPATRHQQASTDSPVAPASDLAAEVTTLFEQISALRSQFSTPDPGPSTQPQVSGLRSQVSAPATSDQLPATEAPVSGLRSQVSASSPVTSYSPHATAAPPLPIYELKETRPVGYQTQGILDSADEEVKAGFFTGLLDRARIQWLMGDWSELAKIELEQIEHHPDRAKLALFSAIGNMQVGNKLKSKNYLAFARAQGCSPKLIAAVLTSGIHSSMHEVCMLAGSDKKAALHLNDMERIGLLKKATLSTFGMTSSPLALEDTVLLGAAANFEVPNRILDAAQSDANSTEPTTHVSRFLGDESYSTNEKFFYLWQLAKAFQKKGNKLLASGFLEEASHRLPHPENVYQCILVKSLLELGLEEDAFEMRLRIVDKHPLLSMADAELLRRAGANLRNRILDVRGHGHELMLGLLKRHAARLRNLCTNRKPVLLEIGTTRESAAGQGSTRRFAEFCHANDFHFITVDMDRANTDMAKLMFQENGYAFESVNSKGEDFLEGFKGPLDFIFLDAYDFDHGMHSDLRQSRYEKFLGSRISESECHQMHLDCTQLFLPLASPWSLVCVDDTWLHGGRWTAKGTLAVPCLLENGYRFLDIRNKAVLMGAKYWIEEVDHGKPY